MKWLGILDDDNSTSDDLFLCYVGHFMGPLTDPTVRAVMALCGLDDAAVTDDPYA